MITMKFGGTSMGSAKNIANVADIICSEKSTGNHAIVVVSAMGGVTNKLLEAAGIAVGGIAKKEDYYAIIDTLLELHIETARLLVQDEKKYEAIKAFLREKIDHFREFLSAISIIQEISPLSHDEIISLGEKLSAALLAAHLNDSGTSAIYEDLSNIVSEIYEVADSDFFEHVQKQMVSRIQPEIDAGKIPILTGFFGKIPNGIAKSVGRGYSDFTAALSGAAFHVQEIQIWTDVDGLLSADPRMVEFTCVLPEVSYDEAGELAQFGAKVLHPQTVWPAVKRNIPVRIKNTMNPAARGTCITREGAKGSHICKSIASKKNVTVITITSARMLMAVGFLSDVFALFKKHNIAVDLIATSEVSVTISVNASRKDLPNALFTELEVFSKIKVLENQAIICTIGTEMRHKKGVAAKILQCIADANVSVHVISQSAREMNMSFIVDENDADMALASLHKSIFER